MEIHRLMRLEEALKSLQKVYLEVERICGEEEDEFEDMEEDVQSSAEGNLAYENVEDLSRIISDLGSVLCDLREVVKNNNE